MTSCVHRWVDVTTCELPERSRYLCMHCGERWMGEPGSCPCHQERVSETDLAGLSKRMQDLGVNMKECGEALRSATKKLDDFINWRPPS